MACNNCQSQPVIVNGTACQDCAYIVNSNCVQYNGYITNNLGISSNFRLKEFLEKTLTVLNTVTTNNQDLRTVAMYVTKDAKRSSFTYTLTQNDGSTINTVLVNNDRVLHLLSGDFKSADSLLSLGNTTSKDLFKFTTAQQYGFSFGDNAHGSFINLMSQNKLKLTIDLVISSPDVPFIADVITINVYKDLVNPTPNPNLGSAIMSKPIYFNSTLSQQTVTMLIDTNGFVVANDKLYIGLSYLNSNGTAKVLTIKSLEVYVEEVLY